jgi:predicted CopG family antitoxin
VLKYAYLHMDTQMASKNLAVREEVYRRLLEAKKGDESFSEVIERLLSGKSDLMSFAGVLSGDKEFSLVLKDIREARKKTVLRS